MAQWGFPTAPFRRSHRRTGGSTGAPSAQNPYAAGPPTTGGVPQSSGGGYNVPAPPAANARVNPYYAGSTPSAPSPGGIAGGRARGAILQRVLAGAQKQLAGSGLDLSPDMIQNIKAMVPYALDAQKKTGIPASALIAVAGQESAYGTNPNTFNSNSAGASGVTQFIPGTAGDYIKGGAATTHKSTPWAIHQQILGAAKLLKANNFNSDPTGALNSYTGGYGSSYNNPVAERMKAFAGLDKLAPGAAGGGLKYSNPKAPYVYPFGKGIGIGRVDMGIDPYPTGSGSTAIRAIGKAKVLATDAGGGWPTEGGQGTGPVYKLLKGPEKGRKIYTFEGITNAPGLKAGQIIPKGTVIARATGDDFETGWSRGLHPKSGSPLNAVASTYYTEGQDTPAGHNFLNLINRIKSGGSVASGGSFGGFGASSTTTTTTSPGITAQPYSPLASSAAAGGTQSSFNPSLRGGYSPTLQPFSAVAPQPTDFLTPGQSSPTDYLSQIQGKVRSRRQRRLRLGI